MLFSSVTFLYYFLPAVLILYFLVPRFLKNAVLLISSLVFYGWGEPKLLGLMIFTILMFYFCGLMIGRSQTQKAKKLWLTVSVVISIGLLGLFKYADFFIDSFNAVTGLVNILNGMPLYPSEYCFDPGYHFHHSEGISQAVIRTGVQAANNLQFIGTLCLHNDWNIIYKAGLSNTLHE